MIVRKIELDIFCVNCEIEMEFIERKENIYIYPCCGCSKEKEEIE